MIAAGSEGGEVLTGATGPFAADQLQYAMWMRSASDHGGVVVNLYDLVDDPPVFVQPMVAVSAALLAAGASIQVALLVWLPVAVVVLSFGVTRLLERHLPRQRRLALVVGTVAVLGGSPTVLLFDLAGARGQLAAEIDGLGPVSPGPLLLGYFPAAVAVGLVPLCLLGFERLLVEDSPARRRMASVAIGALVAAWLHPWEGMLLVVVMASVGLWGGRTHLRTSVVPVAAAGAAVAYYALLPRVSETFATSAEAPSSQHRPATAAALVVFPLLVIVAASIRRDRLRDDVGERVLLVWPVAAVAAFLVVPAGPHMLPTMMLPVAVLAGRAMADRGVALPIAAALALVVVGPHVVVVADLERDLIRAEVQAHRLTADETAALDAIAAGPDGGVLSGGYLGAAIPAWTGHPAWVGHPAWTPSYAERAAAVDAVVNGRADTTQARLVAGAGASFLVMRCGESGPLPAPVASQVVDDRRFGCVRLLELDPPVARP